VNLKGRKPLVIGVVGLVVVLGMVVGMVLPRASQIRKRQADVTAAHDQQQQLEVRLEELRGVQAEAPQNRRRLKGLSRQVPETAQLPNVIDLLNDAASDAAVDFMSIAPADPALAAGGAVSTMPATITVCGDYWSMDEFLFKIERLPRVEKATTFTLTKNAETADPTQGPQACVGDLTITLTSEFYTTDLSAGPGSIPGHTDAAAIAPPVAPSPSSTPGA
jgi:Tfp pilus assembly protein PilO